MTIFKKEKNVLRAWPQAARDAVSMSSERIRRASHRICHCTVAYVCSAVPRMEKTGLILMLVAFSDIYVTN